MAKKEKVNISEAIRQALKDNPSKGPKEIADLLKEKGINVDSNRVSNVKSLSKKGKGKKGKRGGKAGAAPTGGSATSFDTAAMNAEEATTKQASDLVASLMRSGKHDSAIKIIEALK